MAARTQAFDTDPAIEERQIEAWRAMTPAQKLAIVSQLTRASLLRLDRETMIRVFGWDPEQQGY
jgi:hypothetical protein